jgi:hypothetical protein
MTDNSVCMKCRSLEKKNEIRKICKKLLLGEKLSPRPLTAGQDNLKDVKGQGILGTRSARFAYCCTKTRLVCSLC